MRFVWLIPVLLVLALIVCAVVLWRSRSGKKDLAWVANASALQKLPSYRRALSRSRIGVGIAALSLVGALIAGIIVAAGPVHRKVENEALASRDMVLCLDASGSMLPYDGQILTTISDLVDEFSGERVSLQLWSAQSIVKFPLTDDYELVQEVLDQAAQVISSGYMGKEGDYVLVSQALSDYLQGVEAPDGAMVASLVGDGLASCVLGFDHRDSERSRTVILATDNEVQGEQIYSLQQAVTFAQEQGVSIIALYPATGGVLTTEGEELKRVVEASGGSFFQADDPGTVESIIENVQSQQLVAAEGEKKVTETDRPKAAMLWLLWMSLFGVAALAWRRL